MSYPFKMVVKDGLVQMLDALTGRLITKADAEDVSATVVEEVLIDDRFRDVTNYRWIASQLDITVAQAKELYGKEQDINRDL